MPDEGFFYSRPARKKLKTSDGKIIKVPAPPEATSTVKLTNGSSCYENIPTGEVNKCESNVNEVDVLEDAPSEPLPVELEYQGCSGVHYSDLSPKGLDAYACLKDYPMTIHSLSVQSSYNNSNRLATVNWNTDSLENFKSLKCDVRLQGIRTTPKKWLLQLRILGKYLALLAYLFNSICLYSKL